MRKPKYNKTQIHYNDSVLDISLERQLEKVVAGKEPIDSSSPLVYTERKDGVLPQYNIRRDRFDLALEAMGKVDKSYKAKREDRLKAAEKKEVQPSDITERYRGVHRLTKHDDGTEKCVACFMCATACPAECIFIEAEERFDGVDEKRPKEFKIDLLECVFC